MSSDTDECVLDTDGCSSSHWCRNLPGSFICMDCEEPGQVVAEGGTGCIMLAETEGELQGWWLDSNMLYYVELLVMM